MSNDLSPTERPMDWSRSGDVEFPYEAVVDGVPWRVRINDFPDEPLWTLFIADVAQSHLEGWPAAWKRPPQQP